MSFFVVILFFSLLLGNLPRFGRGRVVWADRRGGYDEILFLRVGNFSPASGLLVRRSRPGANIEAPPRFNPRSGRVGLIFLFFWFFSFSSGLRWTMVWRGARFNLRSGRVALIVFLGIGHLVFFIRWTMVWRGARFNPRFGCVALIAFFGIGHLVFFLRGFGGRWFGAGRGQ